MPTRRRHLIETPDATPDYTNGGSYSNGRATNDSRANGSQENGSEEGDSGRHSGNENAVSVSELLARQKRP